MFSKNNCHFTSFGNVQYEIILPIYKASIIWTFSLYFVPFAFSIEHAKEVSSENVIKLTDWSPEAQSFVKRVNKKGDNAHPCEPPVLIMIGLRRHSHL